MRPRENWPFLAFAALAALACAGVFYLPARVAAGGDWPAPLDDVFIHYDFARSLATGHPFEWIAGQGYSSGETAPVYAVVLATGYVLGFHGLHLGNWAALVAFACLVAVARALGSVVRPASAWVAALGTAMLLSCGTLDFAWWSGMEVALFCAVAAGLLTRLERTREVAPLGRADAQWSVGAWGALLVLIRPESAVIVAIASVLVARRAGASSALAACARSVLPGAAATVAILALNYSETGYAASAGALLKLLSSNPFATDESRAKDYVVNIVSVVRKVSLDLGASRSRFALALPALAVLSLFSRRTRGLGAFCLASALGFALLVSWNGAARYQNFRYYMPSVALGLYASTLGLAALWVTRWGRALGSVAALVGVGLAAGQVPEAARFFARASRNIHEQQVEVGRRIASSTPIDAVILVGDAGAIPYVSGRHTVDAFGLGGYAGLPFVRAAVQGEAATVELVERLPRAARPSVLALYPNWFPLLTSVFGHEKDRVTITDNVICGGVTKGIYDADWSALRDAEGAPDEPAARGVVDEIDVADVISEEAHAYVSAAPTGGWTVSSIRENGFGIRRFDGGRIVPDGREESFVVRARAPAGGELLVRTDERASDVLVRWARGGQRLWAAPLTRGSGRAGRWALARVTLSVAAEPGDSVTLAAARGAFEDYHAWLIAPGGQHP